MFQLKQWHLWSPPRLLPLPKNEVTPDPGPKEKHIILPESTPALRIRGHLCRNRLRHFGSVAISAGIDSSTSDPWPSQPESTPALRIRDHLCRSRLQHFGSVAISAKDDTIPPIIAIWTLCLQTEACWVVFVYNSVSMFRTFTHLTLASSTSGTMSSSQPPLSTSSSTHSSSSPCACA